MMDKQDISLKRKVTALEAAEIVDALRTTGWVKARAARMLGITERMIGYKIKKYGIKREVASGGMIPSQGSEGSNDLTGFSPE